MVKLILDIPESFWEAEERCGYYVSHEMKKVWAVLLDMLNEVARICDKYNIRWFADGGTMLGAVRHGGFIPWDDDVDVRMLRPDYDKFIEVAQKEFKHPYFFQTEMTDPGSLRCHVQIRNSETTGILKGEADGRYRFNQGIFLDIFPWDSINDDDALVKQQIDDMKSIIGPLRTMKFIAYGYTWQNKRNILAWIYYSIKGFWLRNFIIGKNTWKEQFAKVDKIMTKYEGTKTMKVGNLCLLRFNKNWHNHREDYEDVIYMPFEMLKIPIPIGYERILTEQFGEWRKFKIGTSIHGGVIFDADNSYLTRTHKKTNDQ